MHYCVHKIPQLHFILSHLDSSYTITSFLFKVSTTVILLSARRPPKWPLPQLSDENSVDYTPTCLTPPTYAIYPSHYISLYVIVLKYSVKYSLQILKLLIV
jgi:hypothetical protein